MSNISISIDTDDKTLVVSDGKGTSGAGGTQQIAAVARTAPGPTARLIILGEPMAGAVLLAHVKRCTDAGSMVFEWLVDGDLVAEGPSFYVGTQMTGKSVQCRAHSEDSGQSLTPLLSDIVTVQTYFQNISLVESQNSFINQFGCFSVNDGCDLGRSFIASARAGAWQDDPGQILVSGVEANGGKPPEHFARYLRLNGGGRVFSTEKDFAVLAGLLDSNRLLVWGTNIPNATSYPLTGIESVYSNRSAFAFIYRDAVQSGFAMGAIGNAAAGGSIPDAVQLAVALDPPRSIHVTDQAFAVLTRAGKVYAWGNANHGGTIGNDVKALLSPLTITTLISSASAFCAIDINGEIVTWGNAQGGGTLPADVLGKLADDGGVETVVAAQSAFCAITRRSRKAFSWGLAAAGGTMQASAADVATRGGIVLCKAAMQAFCIINGHGLAQAWGSASLGGKIDAQANSGINALEDDEQDGQSVLAEQIKSMFSVLGENNNAVNSDFQQGCSSYVTSQGVISIHNTDAGFCILSRDPEGRTRNIVSWGEASNVLSFSTRQILLASFIDRLRCSNGAYAAIVRQGDTGGCVVTWGRVSNDGGTVPADLKPQLDHGVVDVYPVTSVPGAVGGISGFVARCQDGRLVAWGTALPAGTLKASES